MLSYCHDSCLPKDDVMSNGKRLSEKFDEIPANHNYFKLTLIVNIQRIS